jgi:pimeloyl-ACP methyl ester carboxylesterase
MKIIRESLCLKKSNYSVMQKLINSKDGTLINYNISGNGTTALVFVHGWLGNIQWWDRQEQHFKDSYTVIRLDLGGHGKSGKERKTYTHTDYAEDIISVVKDLAIEGVILVGHSMSGPYVLEASLKLAAVKAVVLVDTIKDLDQIFTPEQAENLMFSSYRQNFKLAVQEQLPHFLFVKETPNDVKLRLQEEFLENTGEFASIVLEPLYKVDVQKLAKKISIPVRAINSDANPTSIVNNQKYFKDFSCKIIKGTGHYPMLEKPEDFNLLLEEVLQEFKA